MISMPVSACLLTCMTADTSSLLSVGAAMSPIESRQIFRALNKTWMHTHISQAAGAGVVSWRKHGGPLGGRTSLLLLLVPITHMS